MGIKLSFFTIEVEFFNPGNIGLGKMRIAIN